MTDSRRPQSQLLLDFEETFKSDPSSSAAVNLPFNTFTLAPQRPVQESGTIRTGRNPATPFRGNIGIEGNVIVPLDDTGIGYWLRLLLGDPSTTGSISPYTHVYAVGDTIPSAVLDKGYTDSGKYYKYNGVKVSSMSIEFGGDGELTATFNLFGAKETPGSSAYDASPTDYTSITIRFENFELSLEEGGVSIAILTHVTLNVSNNLDGSIYCIGDSGERSALPEGQIAVTGSITGIFQDDSLLLKGRNFTESSLIITATEGSYSLTFKISELVYEYTSPGVAGPGDGTVMQTIDFVGYYQNNDDKFKITLINDHESYTPVDYIYISDKTDDKIFKFTLNGILFISWGSYGSGDGQFKTPYGIAIDSNGNVYVVDKFNCRIQKFDSDGNFLNKWGTYSSEDGHFASPYGIAIKDNSIYVSDTIQDRIQKFNLDGVFQIKWGSGGTGDGQFNKPQGIAIDSNGNVYVIDKNSHRIQKFDSDGNFLNKWGEYGEGDGQFKYPRGIAIDSNDNIYVADTKNERIQKFDSDGNFLNKWGEYDEGDGQFKYPRGIAIDSNDKIYVADTKNERIQKFDSSGSFLAKWGSRGTGDGQFLDPSDIAIDDNNIYVTDYSNNRIQKFSSEGIFLDKFIISETASSYGIAIS